MPLACYYLENEFQFDWVAEWRACNAIHQRQGLLSSPKTSRSNTDAASATFVRY